MNDKRGRDLAMIPPPFLCAGWIGHSVASDERAIYLPCIRVTAQIASYRFSEKNELQ